MSHDLTVTTHDLYILPSKDPDAALDIWEMRMAHLEDVLDTLGYIPIVSMTTGPVRVQYGGLQIIAGIALGALSAVADTFTILSDRSFHTFRKFSYSIHGLANVVRGFVEFVPLLGNFCCFMYDGIFTRMSYKAEANLKQAQVIKLDSRN